MVSLAATSKKYRNKKAITYDEIRTKQQRWTIENQVVEQMLRDIRPQSVLDVPCGTGRFFKLYRSEGYTVTAVDVSEEMLELSRKKMRRGDRINLVQCSVEDIAKDNYDAAVCVRFLDLIDEAAMQAVMKKLCAAASAVILTIRLGDKYVPKSNTAEHDRKKFLALVKRLGFRVEQEHPVFKAGWVVMKLRRVS